jgi:curved DNA-binding protein CbpA
VPTLVDPYRVLQVLPTADDEVVHAAYRALAMKFHPDRDSTARAAQRMRDLNQAFVLVRTPAARAAFDRTRRVMSSRPAGRPVASVPPPNVDAESPQITFGRYAGWTLRQLARHDPNYLIWLSRHSSGIRYRTEIYRILRTMGRSAA